MPRNYIPKLKTFSGDRLEKSARDLFLTYLDEVKIIREDYEYLMGLIRSNPDKNLMLLPDAVKMQANLIKCTERVSKLIEIFLKAKPANSEEKEEEFLIGLGLSPEQVKDFTKGN